MIFPPIEGFRTLNSDIETIINLSDKVKKAKAKDEKPSAKEKKELTDAEKEYKSKRKMRFFLINEYVCPKKFVPRARFEFPITAVSPGRTSCA